MLPTLSCNHCGECCWAMIYDYEGAPARKVRCNHFDETKTENHCTIYSERPEGCKNFPDVFCCLSTVPPECFYYPKAQEELIQLEK